MSESKTKYVVLSETVLQSWVKDAFTFMSVGGLVAINHQLGKGSAVVDCFAVFAVLCLLVSRTHGRVNYTRDELRRALDEDRL